MKTSIVFTLSICLFLAAACAPAPAATPTAAADNWQTYSNPAGFSIQYPGTWTQQQLPDQYEGKMHTVSLQGTEGHVDLQWRSKYVPLSLAQPACSAVMPECSLRVGHPDR